MPDFGTSFVNAYGGMQRLREEQRRGDIAERADTRAQETHDLDIESKREIEGLSTEIANDSLAYTTQMANWAKEAAQPQPQAQGLVPDGTPAPAPRRAAPTYADQIDAAREHVSKITPKLIKVLARAHPVEAAKLAQAVADAPLQERMVKGTALAGLIRTNSSDPAIPALMEAVFPNVVKGSYRPMPPDKQGTQGYAQFTMKDEDGTTREQAMTPADVDRLLMQSLSPQKVLEELRAGREEGRKETDLASQVETRKQVRDLAERTFKQHQTEWGEMLPIRKAQAASAQESAATSRTAREGMLEEKKESRLLQQQKQVMGTLMNLYGIKAETMQDENSPIRAKFFDAVADFHTLAGANNITNIDQPTMVRLAKAVQDIKTGQRVYQKDGKFVYDTGNGVVTVPQLLLPQQPPQKGLAR